MRCPVCHAANPTGFRFCGSCGERISGAESQASGDGAPWVGDRRHLTVMFCDLVGSTALAERLDPEDMHRIVKQYQQVSGDLIDEAGGYVAQYLGDGLLVYFGFPEAHEDDASRAIGTGLRIVEAFRAMTPCVELPEGMRIQVRIGIHAGEVVTAEIGGARRSERLAMGTVPNTAARLQSLAAPESVLLSDVAAALARDGFELEEHGEHRLKGLTEPIRVYRAVGRKSSRSRFESGLKGAPAQLVGREGQLEDLVERFRGSQAGRAGAVLVRGQPGIGKTRLAQAFADRIASRRHLWFVGQCSPESRNSFLHPIAELIRSWSGVASEPEPARQRALLQTTLETHTLTREALRPIAYLLGIPPPGGETWLQGSPERHKQEVFSALSALFAVLARKRPLVLILEDVHWADPSTLELLERMLEDLADSAFLLLMTQRTGLEHPALAIPTLETIDMHPLSVAEVHAVIHDLTGDRSLPEALEAEIVARAEGVPLFAEELTRAVLSDGWLREGPEGYELAAPLPRQLLPTRLRDLFTARLDRLGTAKELAGMAAVIGSEFGVELLSAVSRQDPRTVESRLGHLETEEILVRSRDTGVYAFKHALIRDAASANLLRSQARELHRRVALALEDRFLDEAERSPERLGRHWAGAGDASKALGCFARAARRARSVFANAEAIAFYREAMEQAEHCAANERSASLGLHLREGLGDVLLLTRQHSEAIEAFQDALDETPDGEPIARSRLLRKIGVASREDDARSLRAFDEAMRELGEPPSGEVSAWRQEWVQIKLELSLTHYWRARVDEMIELAAEIEPFVVDFGTPQQRAELSNNLFLIHMKRSRHFPTPTALKHARSFAEAAEATGDLALLAAASVTLGIVTLDAGDLEGADRQLKRAHVLARKTGVRAVEVRCLTYGAMLHRRRGDVEEARRLAREAWKLAEACDMGIYVHAARAHLAWADWSERTLGSAAEHARAAVAGWNGLGVPYPWSWTALLPLLAAELGQDRFAEAVECAEALLNPKLQALPQVLASALEAVVRASRASQPASALRPHLEEVVRAAESIGYL